MSKRSNDCLAQAQDDYTEYQCKKGKTLNTEYSNYIDRARYATCATTERGLLFVCRDRPCGQITLVSREVSANLDLMTEARRRLRPTQGDKVTPHKDDDLGARAEFVDVGGVEDRSDLDVDDCPIKPELQ